MDDENESTDGKEICGRKLGTAGMIQDKRVVPTASTSS